MNRIDVFYQCEGISEIGQIDVDADATFATVKSELADKHGLAEEVIISLEDDDERIDENRQVTEFADLTVIMVHLNRCRCIEASVNYNGRTVGHSFGPSATIARVKKWAAEEYGMSPEDAGEHSLQIVGTQDRPAPGTHIGRLVCCPDCNLAFDLVADERVNGATGSAA